MMSPRPRQEEDKTPAQETWARAENDPGLCLLMSQGKKEISTLSWWQTRREPQIRISLKLSIRWRHLGIQRLLLTVFGSSQPLHAFLPLAHIGLLKLSGRSEPAGTGAWLLVFLPHGASNQACAFCPLTLILRLLYCWVFLWLSVCSSLCRCFSFQGSFPAYPFFPTVISVYWAFVWWAAPFSSSLNKKNPEKECTAHIHTYK